MSAEIGFLDDYLKGPENEEMTYGVAWARAKIIQEEAQAILNDSEIYAEAEPCAFLHEEPVFFSEEEPSRSFSLVLMADVAGAENKDVQKLREAYTRIAGMEGLRCEPSDVDEWIDTALERERAFVGISFPASAQAIAHHEGLIRKLAHVRGIPDLGNVSPHMAARLQEFTSPGSITPGDNSWDEDQLLDLLKELAEGFGDEECTSLLSDILQYLGIEAI